MPTKKSAYDPEQEIRFAVVLYGGVSLAIYIYGVAQELLRMVRGTADLPYEDLDDTEKLYRQLGQILGRVGPQQELIDKVRARGDISDAPIKSRFVVDILSGSSAGGINGVVLAKALALRLRDLEILRDTWTNKADLDQLLNDDKWSPFKKINSLLNSDLMLKRIRETLNDMNSAERSPEGKPFVDELDLFVTATDLRGIEAPIQLTGHKIYERVHRAVLRFQYDPNDKRIGNQFERDYDPMLTFAARSTSSFPVAFEPTRFSDLKEPKEPESGKQFEEFFPVSVADSYKTREFADGGYLDNRPFSYVMETIPYRWASRPTKRKLLFVDPFPELERKEGDGAKLQRKEADGGQDKPVTFAENAVLAAMTLPRYEVIRGDIQRIDTYNRRLDKLAAFLKRHRDDKEKIKRQKPQIPDHDIFKSWGLDQTINAGYGDDYPYYHHLNVYGVTDLLGRLITRLAGLEVDSDHNYFVRRLVRAWREANYETYKRTPLERWNAMWLVGNPKKVQTENAYLVEFDIEFKARRLIHILHLIDETLAADEKAAEKKRYDYNPLTPDDISAVKGVRDKVRELLNMTKRQWRGLQSRTENPLEKMAPKKSSSEERKEETPFEFLKNELSERYENTTQATNEDDRQAKAREIYTELRDPIDAVMEQIGKELNDTFVNIRTEMENILQGNYQECSIQGRDALKRIFQQYEEFHWHDSLTFSFLEGSGVSENCQVEVFRVSPSDSNLLRDQSGGLALKYLVKECSGSEYLSAGQAKLAGTALGAFGGFLKKEWRAHDIMWGRLDGAERIITALLPEPEPKNTVLRMEYIRKAHDIILREEFGKADLRTKRTVVFDWLTYKLHKLREDQESSEQEEGLIKRANSFLKKFPDIDQVISRQEDGDRTFLQKFYSKPPWPERRDLFGWTARSIKIFEKMLRDFPVDSQPGLRRHLAGYAQFGGTWLTNLLHFTTPHSWTGDIVARGIALVALIGVVLAVVGPVIDAKLTVIGFVALVSSMALWAALNIAGSVLTGRNAGFYRWFLNRAILLALIGLALWKLWEIIVEQDWLNRFLRVVLPAFN